MRPASQIAMVQSTISGGGGGGGGTGPQVQSSTSLFQSANNVALPKPAGVVSGDLLIIGTQTRGGSGTSTPTGFALKNTFNFAGAYSTGVLKLFSKIATGSEGSTFAFTTAYNATAAFCLRISGASSGTFDAIIASSGTASKVRDTQTGLCPSVTPVAAPTLNLLIGAFNRQTDTGSSVTWPGTVTDVVDTGFGGTTTYPALTVAKRDLVASTASGDVNVTFSCTGAYAYSLFGGIQLTISN